MIKVQMECENCKETMDNESKEFAKEYGIDWCLECCAEDYKLNAEKGIWFHQSIPINS